MDASAPLPPLTQQPPTWAEASAFLRQLGLDGRRRPARVADVTEWLDRRADALARATTVDRAALELDVHEVETLLDVAAHAAHDSGDRRNAPLLCYLLGRAARTVAPSTSWPRSSDRRPDASRARAPPSDGRPSRSVPSGCRCCSLIS